VSVSLVPPMRRKFGQQPQGLS